MAEDGKGRVGNNFNIVEKDRKSPAKQAAKRFTMRIFMILILLLSFDYYMTLC